MKTILILSLVLFTNFCSTEINTTSNIQNQSSECKLVTDALAEITSLKVGMKRKDLNKIFLRDGGISTMDENRYVYTRCNSIKVKVKFKLVEPDSSNNPDDEIIEISKPYLEYPAWN